MKLKAEQLQILQSLGSAFADVPYPGDDRITKRHFSTCGLSCQECEDIREFFAGKHWRDYLERPYELLGYFPPRKPAIKIGRDFVSFLMVEGLHLFLPLLLAAIVVDPGEADVMIDSFPLLFDPGPQRPSESSKTELWEWRHGRCTSLLSLMTGEQRQATIAALEPLALEEDDGCFAPTFADAIENLRVGEPVAWMNRTRDQRSILKSPLGGQVLGRAEKPWLLRAERVKTGRILRPFLDPLTLLRPPRKCGAAEHGDTEPQPMEAMAFAVRDDIE